MNIVHKVHQHVEIYKDHHFLPVILLTIQIVDILSTDMNNNYILYSHYCKTHTIVERMLCFHYSFSV
jgi:hypothetical protein